MKNNLLFFSILLFLLTQRLNAQISLCNNKESLFSNKTSIPNKNFFYKVSNNSNSLNYAFKNKTFKKAPLSITYNPKRDPKRLLINTGLYLSTTIISFTTLWLMPESATNWDKEQMKQDGVIAKWKENVQAGPVWDEDDWVLNCVMHPWFGGVYYMTARGSGFKAWESFAYSVFMSTVFWEYGIEAFAEVPSTQDLIVTPVLGSLVGEGFFIAKKKIMKNNQRILGSRALGRFTIFLMDPFNAITNGLGYKTKNRATTTTAFVPVGYDQTSNKTVWGMQISVNF